MRHMFFVAAARLTCHALQPATLVGLDHGKRLQLSSMYAAPDRCAVPCEASHKQVDKTSCAIHVSGHSSEQCRNGRSTSRPATLVLPPSSEARVAQELRPAAPCAALAGLLKNLELGSTVATAP